MKCCQNTQCCYWLTGSRSRVTNICLEDRGGRKIVHQRHDILKGIKSKRSSESTDVHGSELGGIRRCTLVSEQHFRIGIDPFSIRKCLGECYYSMCPLFLCQFDVVARIGTSRRREVAGATLICGILVPPPTKLQPLPSAFIIYSLFFRDDWVITAVGPQLYCSILLQFRYSPPYIDIICVKRSVAGTSQCSVFQTMRGSSAARRSTPIQQTSTEYNLAADRDRFPHCWSQERANLLCLAGWGFPLTMAANGTVSERVMENAASSGRDIRNHMLFEVSTEAANRGIQCPIRLELQSG